MSISKILAKVDSVLTQNPDLINSDKKLQLAVWAREGLVLSKTQERYFMAATSAESIARVRRHLQGKYPMTDAVAFARRLKQSNMRIAFAGALPFQIRRTLQFDGRGSVEGVRVGIWSRKFWTNSK